MTVKSNRNPYAEGEDGAPAARAAPAFVRKAMGERKLEAKAPRSAKPAKPTKASGNPGGSSTGVKLGGKSKASKSAGRPMKTKPAGRPGVRSPRGTPSKR